MNRTIINLRDVERATEALTYMLRQLSIIGEIYYHLREWQLADRFFRKKS